MHYYEYHPKSPEILQKAKQKYSWLFDMNYSDESREVRYHILEYLHREYGYKGILEKDENGKPIPINNKGTLLYWSISHSNNYLAFIVSDSLIGIDIAEHDVRDLSLFDTHSDSEYNILGEKNWNNFYTLWTAKESIIKLNGGKLDDLENIMCIDTQENNISLFAFRHEKYRIQTLKVGTIIISHII